jgi:leader peptidase (prepilin peptidase) / N-methyltransferase
MMFITMWWWVMMGAFFGSAANALIYRLPRNLSWVKGRSMCPNCKHILAAEDLVPLLSYLWLKGKCRYCKKEIGSRYFWIELITAVGFGIIYATGSGNLARVVILSGMWWLGVIIAAIDWQTKFVFDGLVAALAVMAVIDRLMAGITSDAVLAGCLGILIGMAVIGGIWAVSRGAWMGLGDVELIAVLGWWLGAVKISVAIWLAFVAGGIVGVILIMRKKSKLKSEIPFGPFLISGGWAAYFWSERLLSFLLIK